LGGGMSEEFKLSEKIKFFVAMLPVFLASGSVFKSVLRGELLFSFVILIILIGLYHFIYWMLTFIEKLGGWLVFKLTGTKAGAIIYKIFNG
jgi:hypothetical protein